MAILPLSYERHCRGTWFDASDVRCFAANPALLFTIEKSSRHPFCANAGDRGVTANPAKGTTKNRTPEALDADQSKKTK
jgi:hypothetical protein